MKKYLDKIGGFIKKHVQDLKGESGEHNQASSYTIGRRKIKEEKLLSEGAYGYIWRAVDTSTQEMFALKRIICSNEQSLSAARKELEVMRRLKPSPNLVRCYGGEVIKESSSKSTVVLLMELCEGGTLFDKLVEREHTGFTEPELLKILDGVARGIQAIHSVGFTHRDIKIENVLIGSDGNYKICDFGSCTDKTVNFSDVASSNYHEYTDEMEKHTTPMYRAPQMVDPFLKYEVGFKADVWMLGCVLYTLCYFVHPFLQATKIGISRAVFRIPAESKHSDKINDLIRHMLTPNPSYRPSIEAVLDILSQWKAIKRIPLNEEAQRLKKEQISNDQQFGRYATKKTVDHDGDIPLDELLKVQAKLAQKSESEQVVTSFIQKKPTPKNPVANSVPRPQQPAPASNPKPTQPDTFWGHYGEADQQQSKPKVTVNQKDFDFFAEFSKESTTATQKKTNDRPIPTNQNNLTSNDDLFDYFDNHEPHPPASQAPSKTAAVAKSSTDLLDFL